MPTSFYIAQAISILVACISVVVLQLKTMKGLLFGNVLINGLASISYLLLGGYSAMAIGISAGLQCFVMYFYNRKDMAPHKITVGAFILVYVGCSAFFYQSPIDLLPALAAVLFAISISCKRPFFARVWVFTNSIVWIAYDIFLLAYGGLVLHGVILTSTVVAMIRVDGIFRKKNTPNGN